MVRGQLPMAFQGLVVVPLFAGFDEREDVGRVFSFDVVGGRYEEIEFGSTGSGSRLAKAYLRTVYRDDLTADEAAELAVRALVSASQEDTATGGPDLRRGILPNVFRIDSGGVDELPDEAIQPIAESAMDAIR
jgi:proteasome beta subunit